MDEILKKIADLDKQRGDLIKKMDGLAPVTKDELAALKKELTAPDTVYIGSLPMTDISIYGTKEWVYQDSIPKEERPVLTSK